MFEFCFIGVDEISSIEKEWRTLASGPDMTYFQSFEWYKMLSDLNCNIKDSRFEIGYAVLREDGVIKMIAPLWVVRRSFGKLNRKGIYLFGRGQWSDYLNFIYNDWDKNAAANLFGYIKNIFKIDRFYFENLKAESHLAEFIKNNIKNVSVTENICVGLHLPESEEEYNRILSKNSRQNIRTARNRAEKDNIEFIYNLNDENIDLNDFSKFRSVRVTEKNRFDGMNLKWRIFNFVSTRILRRGWYKFKEYAPYTHDRNSRFISLKTKDGTLCAAFNYGIDSKHHQIVLMAVSTNENYARYSPGILLLHTFILNIIEQKEILSVDFTRGNERYKYALGGRDHFIETLEFHYNG